MTDQGIENKQKWKKVYKTEENPLKFNNKLCGNFFNFAGARTARMFLKKISCH